MSLIAIGNMVFNAWNPQQENPLAIYDAQYIRLFDSTHIDRLYDLGPSGDPARNAATVGGKNPTYTASDPDYAGYPSFTCATTGI